MKPPGPPHEHYSRQVFGEERGVTCDRLLRRGRGGADVWSVGVLLYGRFFSLIQFLGLILEMTFRVDNTPTRQLWYGNSD